MNNQYHDIDRFTFYDDSIVTSNSVLMSRKTSLKEYEKASLVKQEKYIGFLTNSAKKTIKKRLTAWLTAIKLYNIAQRGTGKQRLHMPIFVTVTLSEIQTDDDRWIKRNMLEPFLKQLRYNDFYTHHFWKAEKQKNENLHFHIVFDQYIPMKELQDRWNDIQTKKDYMITWNWVKWWEDAPSTHVEGIAKMNRATNYVLKYIQKEKKDLKIDGRVYTFSKELAKLKPFTTIDKYSSQNTVNEFIENESYSFYGSDFFAVDKIRNSNYWMYLPTDIRSDYISYYLDSYRQLYPETSNGNILNAYIKLMKICDKKLNEKMQTTEN